MAYVNVLEWKAEQVADWLRGLDDVVYPYAHFFLNNDLTGQGLLNLTIDDLYKLHVEKLGHQEIILESLEFLRNFHYNLDRENLQYVCLRLSCKARSLYNEMVMYPPKVGEKQVVTAAVMSSVAEVLESVKFLLSWLDRKPFDCQPEYQQTRAVLIRLSLELATNAQRDTFAEQPVDVICSCCDKLAQLADQLIQECHDPLILQPASLDVATVRKKQEEEPGIVVDGGPSGHLVTEVRMLSPTARVEPGDEIVQVNYQTVVGWQTKKVLQLMGENPVELILTLKKRPRHSTFGQIYMKPFRIPARKKSASYYINNLPSPRTELLVVPDISLPILKRRTPSESSSDLPLSEVETDSEDDEAFLPPTEGQSSPTQSIRSVLSRPRSAPQRRATISGASPTHFRPYINVSEIWAELRETGGECNTSTMKSRDSGVSTMSSGGAGGETEEVPQMREKTVMLPPRPVTVLGSFTPSFTPKPNEHFPYSHPSSNKLKDSPTAIRDPSVSRTPKPRMPDPPPEPPGPYVNVPTRLSEYVNVASEGEKTLEDMGPQYVNIQKDQLRQPLPKPRTTLSSVTSSPRTTLSSVTSSDSGSECQDVCKTGRGKRPVPLPRRLPGQLCPVSPPPKDVPIPTANFKSYRRVPGEVRRRASCVEEPSRISTSLSSVRTRISKSMSLTKLSGEAKQVAAVPTLPEVEVTEDKPLDYDKSQLCDKPLVGDKPLPTSRRLSLTSPSLVPTASYVSDVYREGSPEKNWIDSLRSVDSGTGSGKLLSKQPGKLQLRGADQNWRIQETVYDDQTHYSNVKVDPSNSCHSSGITEVRSAEGPEILVGDPHLSVQDRQRLRSAGSYQPVSHFPREELHYSLQHTHKLAYNTQNIPPQPSPRLQHTYQSSQKSSNNGQ